MAFIQFQFRRGLAAEWVSVNPILAEGEQGIETDTGKYKIGDGSSDWNTLTYKGLGYSGYSAYSGYSGLGFSGPSGASGYSGFSAASPGASGYSGYSGYSGKSGYSGFSGAGESGYSGYSGETSTSGFSGYSSVSGYSGYSGYSGAAGGAGSAGSSGFSGFSGAGTSGFSGYSGSAGGAGSTGTSGFSGFSSLSGFSGFSGPSGYSGFSGFSGKSGYSGYSGFSGFSGFSGYSSNSGYSAYSGYSGPQLLTFQTVTDADYPLVLADANTGIKMVSASAHSVNIPLNATQAFLTGTQIVVEQAGAGLVSITVTGGVTLQGASTTNGQYTSIVLIKQATDTWYATSSNLSGYSGYSGPSGFSGFSGKSGYSGYSGYSGQSGYSAFSGYSGAGTYACATGEAFTSTSLANVAGLTWSLVTGTYVFEAYLFGQCTSTAGAKIGINYTGTYTSGDYQTTGLTTSATVQAAPERGTANNTATTLTYMTVATTEQWIYIRGQIITGGSGTFTIRALKVTSGTFTIRASSWGVVAKTA